MENKSGKEFFSAFCLLNKQNLCNFVPIDEE